MLMKALSLATFYMYVHTLLIENAVFETKSTTGNSRSPPAGNALSKKLLSVSGTLLSETFSRKVFIGGLPQDIDEGTSN